ncbi:MAG TPA: hypothetical protein VF342_12285 [Alphaproteobacteria bacterium]
MCHGDHAVDKVALPTDKVERTAVQVKFDGANGELSVTDNGKGFSEVRKGSRGLQLVSMLPEQPKGGFEIRPTAAGTVDLVRFQAATQGVR